jgi:hypothetical protein
MDGPGAGTSGFRHHPARGSLRNRGPRSDESPGRRRPRAFRSGIVAAAARDGGPSSRRGVRSRSPRRLRVRIRTRGTNIGVGCRHLGASWRPCLRSTDPPAGERGSGDRRRARPDRTRAHVHRERPPERATRTLSRSVVDRHGRAPRCRTHPPELAHLRRAVVLPPSRGRWPPEFRKDPARGSARNPAPRSDDSRPGRSRAFRSRIVTSAP